MMQGLYIGATGLKTHGEGMSSVAQNLANVSTVGYKQQSVLFDDLMPHQKLTGQFLFPQTQLPLHKFQLSFPKKENIFICFKF